MVWGVLGDLPMGAARASGPCSRGSPAFQKFLTSVDLARLQRPRLGDRWPLGAWKARGAWARDTPQWRHAEATCPDAQTAGRHWRHKAPSRCRQQVSLWREGPRSYHGLLFSPPPSLSSQLLFRLTLPPLLRSPSSPSCDVVHISNNSAT